MFWEKIIANNFAECWTQLGMSLCKSIVSNPDAMELESLIAIVLQYGMLYL